MSPSRSGRRWSTTWWGGGAVGVFRGEKVVDIWAEPRPRRPPLGERDTTATSWSTSKGVVATAAHRLADRGLLDVDVPVGDDWPEFKAAGKEDIRVADLLDHSAGMHRVRGIIDDAEELLDWDRTTEALAAVRLRTRPAAVTVITPSRSGSSWARCCAASPA